ncbi:uncharacterized protein LOC112048027 [Bicyclus anynana]|uniref:Uncharacterized protein LOC112048027 n=1 Tax=Bicyclus anynana TaxID=110368 RepID=A0A6J1MZX3_BICAN|nr:uncharacterized protein LOC112048027 [Bicyclus anynana]XP_023941130.2 uncharacterized protein LOC112048027 [Bicyclus anynana]
MDEKPQQTDVIGSWNPVNFVLSVLEENGWLLLALCGVSYMLYGRIRQYYEIWKTVHEDAEYHKDPDKMLMRMEDFHRVRELQQRQMEEATKKAWQQEKEREERKRQENLERLQKYGAAGGSRLGDGDDFLPLSGGGSTSSYRPPKRSACSRGGCGR